MLCTVDGEGTITVQTKQKFRGRNVSLHLRKGLLSLMEMFHLLKVLYWYSMVKIIVITTQASKIFAYLYFVFRGTFLFWYNCSLLLGQC